MPKILGVHSIVNQDDIYMTGFTNFASGSMKLTNTIRNTGYAISIDNTGTFTKLVALKAVVGVQVTLSVSRSFVQNGVNSITRFNSLGVSQEIFQTQQSTASSSVGTGVISIVTDMNVGDYLAFSDQNNTGVTNAFLYATCIYKIS